MNTVPFRDVPYNGRFLDPKWDDEPCIKTGDTTARDAWCALGWDIGFAPDEMVRVEEPS